MISSADKPLENPDFTEGNFGYYKKFGNLHFYVANTAENYILLPEPNTSQMQGSFESAVDQALANAEANGLTVVPPKAICVKVLVLAYRHFNCKACQMRRVRGASNWARIDLYNFIMSWATGSDVHCASLRYAHLFPLTRGVNPDAKVGKNGKKA